MMYVSIHKSFQGNPNSRALPSTASETRFCKPPALDIFSLLQRKAGGQGYDMTPI
jgi:hypothetical protein